MTTPLTTPMTAPALTFDATLHLFRWLCLFLNVVQMLLFLGENYEET